MDVIGNCGVVDVVDASVDLFLLFLLPPLPSPLPPYLSISLHFLPWELSDLKSTTSAWTGSKCYKQPEGSIFPMKSFASICVSEVQSDGIFNAASDLERLVHQIEFHP